MARIECKNSSILYSILIPIQTQVNSQRSDYKRKTMKFYRRDYLESTEKCYAIQSVAVFSFTFLIHLNIVF